MSGQTATYLRPKEVEAEYPVSVKKLENLRRVGRGPAYYQRGRDIIYKRQEVEKWIEAGRVQTRD